LFPLVRAYLNAKDQNSLLYEPPLRQIKIGTIFRREKDKRFYSNIVKRRNFQNFLRYLGLIFFRASRLRNFYQIETGLGDLFLDFPVDRATEIRRYLELRSGYCNIRAEETKFRIGVHLRGTDFSDVPSDGFSYRLPCTFFEDAIAHAVKLAANKEAEISVFTDGCPLYASFSDGRYAIDDSSDALAAILKLSDCDAIICSRSTFSLWACFLSKSDTKLIFDNGFSVNRYIDLSGRSVVKIS
jgi:hypothetical protein